MWDMWLLKTRSSFYPQFDNRLTFNPCFLLDLNVLFSYQKINKHQNSAKFHGMKVKLSL